MNPGSLTKVSLMKSDLVDLEVALHHQTDKAYLVSTTGDRKDAVWLPKSACELEDQGSRNPGIYTLTLPQSLATEKGLV